MNGLVGIIIVTNSSRGHHFVYKYPRERGGITPDDASGRPYQANGSSSSTSTPASSPATTEEFQVTSKVLGYDPQFLANLLSPKLALCDKRFQLTVDDLTFIGHPVSMSGPEFRQRRDYWKYRTPKPQKEKVKRGWIVEGAAPFLGDSDDSDSDFYDEDSNDEGDSARGSVTSKGAKDGPSGTGAGAGSTTATMSTSTSVVKEMLIRRGSKEESDSTTTTRSLTDPTGRRQQRFRSHTYNSNPVSPASGDSPLSGQITQQQNTPLLTHHTTFASNMPSLLQHPVSMPQTPTGGIQGSIFSSHLGILPPIQIAQGNVSTIFSHTVSTPSTHFQQMSFFHVVFVLKPPELQLNSVADQVYKNIACKLTAALRYEELNSQYVSQEATKILAIREEAAQAAVTLEKFHEQVLASSSLARAVRSIYDCISADKVCHVVLNDSIDISLQIPHLAPLPRASSYVTRQIQSSLNGDSPTTNGNNTGATSSPAIAGTNTFTNSSNSNISASQQALIVSQYGVIGGLGYMMDDFEVGSVYEYENFPVLFPYHTLLLLEDPEEILKDIPLDASPTLVKLVQILVPYQCLDELQYILDCSMAQIYRLASHLIYWRKAKLIDQIRISNVYVVAPQAGINESLVNDFSHHFPTLSLPSVLHELSTPKAYKAHIPGAGKDKEVQTVYLEMLTYLLRKDLVVQLHTYILIIVPEYIKLGCSVEEYEHLMSEENSGLFSHSHGGHLNGGMLTPTLESPTLLHHGTSAKSADFALLQHQQLLQQQQQQQQYMQKQQQQQQTMPSQTYRYHSRSSTGPKTSDATGGGTSSSGPALHGGPSSANSVGTGAIGPVSASVSGGGGVGMISSSLKSHVSAGSPFARLYGKRQDASSILSNPGQASEIEREWVMRMCENQPQSVAELFMRLIHYFDGQHHVEEILFREQIVAKDLKTVLSAFREFLILTWA